MAAILNMGTTRSARMAGSISARQNASVTDDTAISYEAAVLGTPVLSSTGLRFIDADKVQEITRSYIQCSLFRRPHWNREQD
jgi:hypothetical protein